MNIKHSLAEIGLTLAALVVFVCGLLLGGKAHAQPAVAPVQKCLPGFYGKQWPGTDFNAGTRTGNGWYAFVFCDAGGGRLWPRMAVCAHGECASQVVYGAALGRLQIESFAAPDKAAVFEAAPEASKAFTCGPFDVPAGGVQPYDPPPANPPLPPLPMAEPGSARALICADAFAAVKLKWPLAAVLPPPPASAPTYVYAVKPNGAFTTRPAYAVINGVRGTKEVARATVGQPCKTPTGDGWGEFGPDFKPALVALCGK